MFSQVYTCSLVLIHIICLASSQPVVSLGGYYITSVVDDIIYTGGSVTIDCNALVVELRICPVPARLADNITLEGEQFDSNRFIGWRENVSLVFDLVPDARVTRIEIYFYNNPSEGFGLPPLPLEANGRFGSISPVLTDANSNPVPVSFTDNSHFTQADDSISVVSVAVASDEFDTYQYLSITFDSSSTLINQTFISEVKLFGSESGSGVPDFPSIQFLNLDDSMVYGLDDNILSTVDLSCTVINNGSFRITWTGPNGSIVDSAKTRIYSADTSRTSILGISDVSLTDNGTYSCEASYTHFSAMLNNVPSGTTSITLTLTGSVSHPDSVLAREGDESVSLQCNFTGYLPSTYINVIWRNNDDIVLEDSTEGYNISTSMGGPGRSSIDGSIFNSGVISVLTIDTIEESDFGRQYTCMMEETSLRGTIQLLRAPRSLTSSITATTVSSSSTSIASSSSGSAVPTTSATPPPTDDESFVGPAVGGAVGGLIFFLLVAIVIVLVLLLVLRRKKKIGSHDLGEVAMYSEVSKPALPPRPLDQMVNDGYATINLPEDDDDEFLMKSPTSNGSNLHPTRISSRPDFLQPNPMYTSRENVTNSPMHKTSSLPFLDRMDEDDYKNSMFNIYAEASKPPAVPSYHGTPEPLDSVYSEDLNPSVFRDALQSNNDDLYQLYRSVYSNPQPLQRSSEALLEVKEKNIRKLKDLGMGQFGEVELAHTVGLSLKKLRLSESNNDPGVSLVVAVKRLKAEADDTMREAFENEIKFMARLNHENVVRLLGVCLSKNAFIMMEYMEEGDLNNYLKAQKFVTVDSYPLPEGTVDVAVLVYVCLQVAAGMRYLADLRYIHRDLATRNILVGQDFKVKIADFGMSQQLYSSFYYRIKGKAVLPIRWMANECFYGRFSEKTDVWSYGVLMWEVFTLCRQQPYEHFTDQELIDDAIKGEDRTLMSRPDTCPEEVYHVMLRCWANNPEDRANFDEVHGLLLQIHAYNQDI